MHHDYVGEKTGPSVREDNEDNFRFKGDKISISRIQKSEEKTVFLIIFQFY